jgi:hypothetical protein
MEAAYTTKDGVRLELGRIPRQDIDEFVRAHPLPEPPMQEIEAFGGVTEEVPMHDDQTYQRELREYYQRLGEEQIGLIAPAVQVLDGEPLAEMEELRALQIVEDDSHADVLRYVVLGDAEDLTEVVRRVFYNSTVTQQGIDEASAAFGVEWLGQPVGAWKVPSTPGKYGAAFEARKAARYSGYAWEAFCTLTGPEQSAVVAFYREDTRLEALMVKREQDKSEARTRAQSGGQKWKQRSD